MKGPHYPARVAVAMVLACALLAWWAWPDGARPGVGLLPWQAPAASAPATSAVATASAPAAQALTSLFSRQPVWDVCGVGRVTVPAGTTPEGAAGLPLPDHLGRYAFAAARERTLAALRAGDARSQAAAMLLQGGHEVRSAGADPALLPLALASLDPVVLHWAKLACRRAADPADCRRQLARAAVEADPGNAMAWQAWMRHAPDPEAAWQQLLQAPRWRSHHGALAATVQAAVPADVLEYLRGALSYEALAMESVLMDGPWEVLQRCSPDAPQAPRDACDRLAHLLVERSDTLLTRATGRSVAQAAGWPDQRLQALQSEQKQLAESLSATMMAIYEQPFACTAVREMRRMVDAFATVGELQAARDALERRPPR